MAGKTFIPLVRWAAAVVPKVMADPALRGMLSNEAFIKYHTNLATTPGLVNSFFQAMGSSLNNLVSPATQALVAAAVAAPWDRAALDAIPVSVVAMAYQWHLAAKTKFGEWYQGTKAANSVPSTSNLQWRAAFERMVVIMGTSGAIASAADVNAVITALPATMKGV